MTTINPTDKESPFEPHELFFSKTDKRGIILAGNVVFVRVSGHAQEALIGSPHNIIRHPDMPKTVFKLFWDTIQAGHPIGAYVKNMSKDGSYYWVFAAVWPVSDGYLSLRLKPTSETLEKVRKLYESLRAEERSKRPQETMDLLIGAISRLGFRTYQEFMAFALVEEFTSRDRVLARQGTRPRALSSTDTRIGALFGQMTRAAQDCAEVFRALSRFKEIGGIIKADSETILKSFKDLAFLSTNLAAYAERVGEEGRTLSEISEGFEKVAEEIRSGIETFHRSMTEVQDAISVSQFQVGGARLQLEMTGTFLMENAETRRESEAFAGFESNFEQLLELASSSAREVAKTLIDLRKRLSALIHRCESLCDSLNGLDVIRVSGKIEVSRLADEHISALNTYIGQMKDFITNVSHPLTETRGVAREFVMKIQDSIARIARVEETLGKMHLEEPLEAHRNRRSR